MPTFSDISDQLAHQVIELPSWAFGNSGTRFKVFGSPGTPRTVEKDRRRGEGERADRARPKVALHIPWDRSRTMALREYAADLGMALGTIN
jgi:L-rhamnose isomerase/sugar isomerase